MMHHLISDLPVTAGSPWSVRANPEGRDLQASNTKGVLVTLWTGRAH